MTDLAGKDRVTIGVIGGRSWIANGAVIPAIEASRGARLGSVGSRSGPIGYQDVLDDPGNDAVYIPLPNGMHLEWVERAAAAGKHVLCEKPLAATVAEVEAMAAACDRAGVLLAEAYMSPYHPRSIEIARILDAGDLGEIRHAHADFTFTLAAWGPDGGAGGGEINYRWLPEQGGGALLDVGIYCLTPIVRAFGEPPARVSARAVTSATGVDSSTMAWLEWPAGNNAGSGGTASVVVSFELPERQWLHIAGTEGALSVERPFTPGPKDTDFELRRSNGSVERCSVGGADCYVGMVDAFADALTGRAAWPRPVADVVANLRLCDRIARAAATGGAA
jgi:D-xylose 1-dehydrogenase (NADP+, D-xylono-1,5-lactone-forming)